MKVAEIYQSVQGEGLLTGVESTFVRTSGCNLRCWYCDTPFASWAPEGEDLSVEEIFARVVELEAMHVVLTGGEPMLFAEIDSAGQQAARARLSHHDRNGRHALPAARVRFDVDQPQAGQLVAGRRAGITVVNAARTHALRPRCAAEADRQTSLPGEVCRQRADRLRRGRRVLARAAEIDRSRAMLMPQGTDAAELERQAEWLEPYCHAHDLQFCPRKHIEWFGFVRGR